MRTSSFNKFDVLYIVAIVVLTLLFWPLGFAATAIYCIVLIPRNRKSKEPGCFIEVNNLTQLNEMLNLVSNKQEIDIRLIINNDFSSGKTIYKGLLMRFDPNAFKFILNKRLIGIAAISNTILIYIEANS